MIKVPPPPPPPPPPSSPSRFTEESVTSCGDLQGDHYEKFDFNRKLKNLHILGLFNSYVQSHFTV